MRKRSKKRSRYVYLYLIFASILGYAVQDFLTSRNTTGEVELARGGVYLALLALLILLGVYYAYTTASALKHPTIRQGRSDIKTALWLITGWIALSNLLQNTGGWSVSVNIGMCLLWILSYHFYGHYIWFFPNSWVHIQMTIMIMFGFYVFSAGYGTYVIRNHFNRLVVVNLAYNVVVFLPWIVLINGRKMRWFGIGIILLIVLVSLKRGAIVVFPLMLITSILVDSVIRKSTATSAIKITTLVVLCLICLLFVDHYFEGGLNERFTPERVATGSGRDAIYSATVTEILGRNLWTLMIGSGSGSSIRLVGVGTHNDFLEFLFAFGVIGMTLYVKFCYAILCRLRYLIRISCHLAPAYAMAFVYVLTVGMYGSVFFSHSMLFIVAFFGVIEGRTNSEAGRAKMFTSDSLKVV